MPGPAEGPSPAPTAAQAEQQLATALTNYLNTHPGHSIPSLIAVNNQPTEKSKGTHCKCCGAPGRTSSGCSCRGGKSHVCLKLKVTPKVHCKCCGAAGRLATGRSCTGGKSHLCLRQEAEPSSASAAAVHPSAPALSRGQILQMRWRRMVKKQIQRSQLNESDFELLDDTEVAPTSSKKRST